MADLMKRVVGQAPMDYPRPNGTSVRQIDIDPVGGEVEVCATIHTGPANPIEYAGCIPCWDPGDAATTGVGVGSEGQGELAPALGGFVPGQKWEALPEDLPQFLLVINLGTEVDGGFVSLLRFGLADDRRGLARGTSEEWFWGDDRDPGRNRAHVCAWISDGCIDYFGPFARPSTPYDFNIRLDTEQQRMTAWVSGRGDDDWFLLAEDVALSAEVSRIDRVRITLYENAPQIAELDVRPSAHELLGPVRPHPLAKPDRVVGLEKGFTFQSVRSTWRKPGKHVTIFRRPGVAAGFPDVCQAEPNHLICVWHNGSHTGGTGGHSIAHSFDGGRTWGERRYMGEPGGRIQRLADGTLLLSASRLWGSRDGGRTWEDVAGPLQPEDPARGGPQLPLHWHCRAVELADGSWLAEPSIQFVPAEEIVFLRSTDRGQTWKCLSNPKVYPPYCLSESSTLEVAPGRLVVYARESRADGMPAARGDSEDGGVTWRFRDMPFPMTGRPCAGFLKDGRVMITFRTGVGRAGLWAWIGEVNDLTGAQPVGGHFNDRHSVGLKDGALHIDSDGVCGQFTKYNLRPTDTERSTVELTFEVQVVANAGRAASVSIPFAGVLRLFPDHVVMAHDPSLRAEVIPGPFHTYRVLSRVGRMALYVDGKPAWDTDQGDSRLQSLPWTKTSAYGLAFGNEAQTLYETFGYGYHRKHVGYPDVFPVNITLEVTGYSLWRRFEAVTDDPDPKVGRRTISWVAERDGFPDQYQLDHIIEVDACANGQENGYSGWVQLDDGRVFVVNYTDDTAAAGVPNPHMLGVPWIRGTFLDISDLPSASRGKK